MYFYKESPHYIWMLSEIVTGSPWRRSALSECSCCVCVGNAHSTLLRVAVILLRLWRYGVI